MKRAAAARAGPLAAAAAFLHGCGGLQSALDAAGPSAREIAILWWWMLGGSVAIFALVVGVLLYALFAGAATRERIAPLRLIVGGGIVLPIVVLSLLVPFNAYVASGATAARSADTLTIRVRGRQWWWQVAYDPGTPAATFETANEIYLPVGRPVELILTSPDVIHSFWVPRLAGKIDLIPGRKNRLMIEADEPGVFRGQCAEFCGAGHTKMALYVVAVESDRFETWMEHQRRPAAAPADPSAQRGAELFAATGCPLCHTVRGRGAWGRGGPDLTHVGSRLTIGAGLLQPTRENIATWIAHNDALKRGNRMPDYVDLDAQTRSAIGAYLESLE